VIHCLFLVNNTSAQTNFVTNGSFEQLDSCHIIANSIHNASPWDTLKNGGGGGADLLTFCAKPIFFKLPLCAAGFQYPRTGKTILLLDLFGVIPSIPYYKDYIQSKLTDTLIIGQTYCVTFYVNLTNRSKYAIDKIGAYLDDGSVSTCWYCCANVTPQIESPQFTYLQDTLNWMKVQGSFTATGTENYITIGSFIPNNLIDTLDLYSTWPSAVSEYLIDDVSVIATGSSIKADNDTLIAPGDTVWLGKMVEGFPCEWYNINGSLIAAGSEIKVAPMVTTKYVVRMDLCGFVSYDTVEVRVWGVGVNQTSVEKTISIYPNPNNGRFTIQLPNSKANYNLVVKNIQGQIIYEQIISSNNNAIPIELKNKTGLFFLTVQNLTTNQLYVKKIVIQ
jgi:Secretion system C-terminal sorting domain